jgi:hypothetical protein
LVFNRIKKEENAMLGLIGLVFALGSVGAAVAVGKQRKAPVDGITQQSPEKLAALLGVQVQAIMRALAACPGRQGACMATVDRLAVALANTATALNLPQFATAIRAGAKDADMAKVTELWPGTNKPILKYIQEDLGIK